MKVAVALLTRNRPQHAGLFIGRFLECHPWFTDTDHLAVFEDHSDISYSVLLDAVGCTNPCADEKYDQELRAYENQVAGLGGEFNVYLGRVQGGVKGNANRALRWFERLGADVLFICADDLLPVKEFVPAYAAGLALGPLCYQGPAAGDVQNGRVRLKSLPKLMVVLTKDMFRKVGYFDSRFGLNDREFEDYVSRLVLATSPIGTVTGIYDLHGETRLGFHKERPRASEREDDIPIIRVDYGQEGVWQPFSVVPPAPAAGMWMGGLNCTKLGCPSLQAQELREA